MPICDGEKVPWLTWRLPRLLRALLGLVSVYYLGLFAYVACARVGYRFDLEWMEGATLEHVARVVAGKPLYVAPSLEFTPFIYTPLYYWVCAPFVGLFGVELSALRAVSIAATLGLFGLLFISVTSTTRDSLAGLSAAGLFAASFAVGGAWLDLARVDALFLFLVFAGVCLFVRDERFDLAAGLCFAAAVLAKQTALIVVLPLCATRAITARGWNRVRLSIVVVGLLAGATALLQWRSEGWFLYYVYSLPRAHGIARELTADFWRDDLLRTVPFALALALYQLGRPGTSHARFARWGAAVGFIGSAWSGRMHPGGWDNVLIPAFLFLAWMGGEAIGRARVAGPRLALPKPERLPCAALVCPLLALLQLGTLWYTPAEHLPTEVDRRALGALVGRLRSFDGPILSPFHPQLGRLAGKGGSAHDVALLDVLRGGDIKVSAALRSDIQRALRERRYAVVVLDRTWWAREVGRSYRPVLPAPVREPDALLMRTGFRIRPSSLHVPRGTSPSSGGSEADPAR